MTPADLLDLESDAFRSIVDRDARHGQRNIEPLDDETRRSLRSPEVVGRWSALLDGIVAQFHRQQEAAASERAARVASSEVTAITQIETVLRDTMGGLMDLVSDKKATVVQLKDAITNCIGAASAALNDHGAREAEAERDFHHKRTGAMRILAQHELRAAEARSEKERFNSHRLNTLLHPGTSSQFGLRELQFFATSIHNADHRVDLFDSLACLLIRLAVLRIGEAASEVALRASLCRCHGP